MRMLTFHLVLRTVVTMTDEILALDFMLLISTESETLENGFQKLGHDDLNLSSSPYSITLSLVI